jgi:multidrug resistance efflux pump
LIFELSSEEEINTLSEVSWRLTILSGKLARVFNLISQNQLEEARKEVDKIKAELSSCRQLIGQVKQKLLISFDEVNSYLGKLEILIKTAEGFLRNQEMGDEEKEKVKEQMKEVFSTSLEALSLSERNRAELVQQAELKLQKAARILGVK